MTADFTSSSPEKPAAPAWRLNNCVRRIARRLERAGVYLLLVALSALFLAPLLWLALSSLKQEAQLFAWPPTWLPDPWWPQNYVRMFELVPLAAQLKNTLVVICLGVSGTVISSALVGYGFARFRAPGLKLLFGLCLATLMLPAQVTMIPTFLIFSKLGLVDTLFPLWLPSWLGGGAFNIFLFKQFFSAIPRELEEAALVDGASRLTVFREIILPLSKPVIVIVTVFSVQWFWTDILGPVIYLNSQENLTLALGVLALQGVRVTQWGPLLAANMLMTVPMIIVYFIAQRYIVQGIVLSGFK